jgi:hypothetical protein
MKRLETNLDILNTRIVCKEPVPHGTNRVTTNHLKTEVDLALEEPCRSAPHIVSSTSYRERYST